jgi:hypothetical protein
VAVDYVAGAPGRPHSRWSLVLLVPPVMFICTVNSVLSMLPDPDTASVMLAADWMYPLADQVVNPLAAGLLAFALAIAISVITVGGRRATGTVASPGGLARN